MFCFVPVIGTLKKNQLNLQRNLETIIRKQSGMLRSKLKWIGMCRHLSFF